MSSELPDGQGVWHYDETVNICNIYLNFYSHIYLYTYTYCIWTLSVTRYASVVVVSVFGVVVLIYSAFISCEFDFGTIQFLCNIQYNKTVVLFESFVLLFGVELSFLSNGRCGSGPGWTSFFVVVGFFVYYLFRLVVL